MQGGGPPTSPPPVTPLAIYPRTDRSTKSRGDTKCLVFASLYPCLNSREGHERLGLHGPHRGGTRQHDHHHHLLLSFRCTYTVLSLKQSEAAATTLGGAWPLIASVGGLPAAREGVLCRCCCAVCCLVVLQHKCNSKRNTARRQTDRHKPPLSPALCCQARHYRHRDGGRMLKNQRGFRAT